MKYHIITYGCQMNKSDSERLMFQLEQQGHQRAKNLKIADLIVLNVCSVRQSAIDRIRAKISQIKKDKFPGRVILTGCILDKDKEKFKNQTDKIWPITKLNCRPKHQSKDPVFVPIMTGCNNFCSYCAVPYTRGKEHSRPAFEIIKEVENLVKRGYKKIVLLGQNVNSYRGNFKIQNPKSKMTNQNSKIINFSELLGLIDNLPGNFQIKFLTSHPKDMSDELIKVMTKCEKTAKEIHLPVQSGDNEILKKMNRGYKIEYYKNLIKKIRRRITDVKISTDAIVGFPGETKKQFQNTVKLFKWAKFDKAYVARYSSRPGTAAAKLKDNVSNDEKKRRWKILSDLLK